MAPPRNAQKTSSRDSLVASILNTSASLGRISPLPEKRKKVCRAPRRSRPSRVPVRVWRAFPPSPRRGEMSAVASRSRGTPLPARFGPDAGPARPAGEAFEGASSISRNPLTSAGGPRAQPLPRERKKSRGASSEALAVARPPKWGRISHCRWERARHASSARVGPRLELALVRGNARDARVRLRAELARLRANRRDRRVRTGLDPNLGAQSEPNLNQTITGCDLASDSVRAGSRRPKIMISKLTHNWARFGSDRFGPKSGCPIGAKPKPNHNWVRFGP